MKLSQEQARFFRDMGYLKLGAKVSPDDIADIHAVISKHVDGRIQPFRTDAAGRIIRLDQVFTRDSVFARVFSSPLILDPLESLLGPNIEITLNRHNHVTFNDKDSAKFRLHRDVLQWSRSLVTAVLYLEDATVDTGCTHLIPGSQYFPFAGIPNNGGTWMDEHYMYRDFLGQALPVPMEAGGILIFDSLVFHTVGENHSDHTRFSVCMGFHSVDELAGVREDPRRFLVRGASIYKGNDI